MGTAVTHSLFHDDPPQGVTEGMILVREAESASGVVWLVAG
jgi:hypothetical protein